MPIDRRALLKALSAAAAGALAARALPALAQAPAAAQFGKLSAALTGYPEPDAATAAKMLRAFATPQRRAALASLAEVVSALTIRRVMFKNPPIDHTLRTDLDELIRHPPHQH